MSRPALRRSSGPWVRASSTISRSATRTSSAGIVAGTLSSADTIASACAGCSNTPTPAPLPPAPLPSAPCPLAPSARRPRLTICLRAILSLSLIVVGQLAVAGAGVRGWVVGQGVGVGEGGGDGGVFVEGGGEVDVAAGFGRVDAVAERQQPGGGAGAEFVGVAGGFEAGDEVQGEGFEAGDLGVGGVETRTACRCRSSTTPVAVRESPYPDCKRRCGQFSNPDALVFKGFRSQAVVHNDTGLWTTPSREVRRCATARTYDHNDCCHRQRLCPMTQARAENDADELHAPANTIVT